MGIVIKSSNSKLIKEQSRIIIDPEVTTFYSIYKKNNYYTDSLIIEKMENNLFHIVFVDQCTGEGFAAIIQVSDKDEADFLMSQSIKKIA